MNIKTAAITMSVVVATIIVAGALVFPYNYAMAGKNQDASKSNTHNGVQIGGTKDNGNVGHGNTGTANIGNGNVGSHNVGNGNTGRNNIRNGNTGSNFVGDPIPGSIAAPLFIPGADASFNKQSNDATYTGPKPKHYQ